MARSPAQLRAIFAALRGKGTIARAKHLKKQGFLRTSRSILGGKLQLAPSWTKPLTRGNLMKAMNWKKGARPLGSFIQRTTHAPGFYKGGRPRSR